MKKTNKQLVPVFFGVSLVLFGLIVYTMVGPAFTEYSDTKSSSTRSAKELENAEQTYNKAKEKRAQEEIQLKSIKQVYQTEYTGEATDNLAMYGTMFDDLIRRAEYNNLFIRSIEYDTKPVSDSIYSNFSEQYNACELKFVLVGRYSQLRNFLKEVTEDFKYLSSISRLSITSFTGDTDFILVDMGITLYSKKPTNDEE